LSELVDCLLAIWIEGVKLLVSTLYYKKSLTQPRYRNDPPWRDTLQGQELRLQVIYCLRKENNQSTLSSVLFLAVPSTNNIMSHGRASLLAWVI
jgi:late competence protein required for DNA uptake (superfamily II DNA/RNA helicase)